MLVGVDPARNPYTPNAGAAPPALVGRDDQLNSFEMLLTRLVNGYTCRPPRSVSIKATPSVGTFS